MKQTAVEYFYQRMYAKDITAVFEQAKEMEKKQCYSEQDMKEAFFDGWVERDGKFTFSKAIKKWFEEFKKI
jgi:hypothetical protein